VLVLAAALAAAAALTQSAAAVPPTTTEFGSSGSFQLAAGTLCAFAIDVGYAQQGSFTTTYNNDGSIHERVSHGTEQDTFSANGKTLIGDTYHFMFLAEFEDGVRVAYHANGVQERVNLPDGSVFIIAGRIDVLAWLAGGSSFIVSVDSGNAGNNLGTFCAALS